VIVAWRLTQEKWVSTAFSGKGAELYGGRWNSIGVPVVYLSECLSLAILEEFVHTETFDKHVTYAHIKVEIPDDIVKKFAGRDLPADWQQKTIPVSTQRLGTAWAKDMVSALLKVPSVVVPEEHNYIVNPLHPDFGKIRQHAAVTFTFDSRMWKK
jgi:RES domain-containing protein